MISDVTFYSAPISHRNRVFPLGAPGAQYKKTTVKDALCVEDLAMRVHVDWFTDWDKCNLVYLHTSQEYYWINQMGTVTNNNKQVVFDLVLNPVTSYIKKGDTLKGVWDRLPTNVDGYIKETIGSDTMVISRTQSFTQLPEYTTNIPAGVKANVVWYEISTRRSLKTSSSLPKEKFTTYGGFAITTSKNPLWDDRIHGRGASGTHYDYPSLKDIVNHYSGINESATTEDIVSLSVSSRCPYDYYTDEYGNLKLTGADAYSDYINWTSPAENPINEVRLILYVFPTKSTLTPKSSTLTITLTPDEQKYGEINILNNQGSIVTNLPNELFKNGSLEIGVRCFSDLNGLFSQLSFAGTQIRIPEGKLPYVGSAWAEYMARSMDSDRASMNLAISSAKEQRNIDAVMSISNAVTSGGLGWALGGKGGASILGATTAITGLIGSELQGRLEERTARAEQEITENHAKQQLSNNFDVGYGLQYLVDECVGGGLMVSISMPNNLSSYLPDYHNEYGYKVQGVRTITVDEGYHKGRLLEFPINGLKGDLLNNEFIEGLKLVKIGGIE